MARISTPPNFPKISFPACPSTVETGKFGISVYEISYLSVISEANCPNPVPRMMAVCGCVVILSLSHADVS